MEKRTAGVKPYARLPGSRPDCREPLLAERFHLAVKDVKDVKDSSIKDYINISE
jgi:hypothetical protein